MESFCIADRQLAWFFPSPIQVNDHCFVPRHDKVKAKLPSNFSALNNFSGEQFTKQEVNELFIESELKVEIMFPEQPNGNGGSTGVMRIEPLGENNFLKQIWKKKEHLGKVFLSWDVKDFGDVRGVGEKYDWKAKCVELNSTTELQADTKGFPFFPQVYRCTMGIPKISASTINLWRRNRLFTGQISIFLNIPKSPYQLAVEQEHFSKMRRMLEQSIDTDLELKTSESEISVKCHRTILSIGSKKIGKLIKMGEGQSKTGIMEHFSVDCVKAFLLYIYCFDTTKVFSSTCMALEVLEASLDFEVLELVSHIQNYLNMKQNNEIGAGECVKLFEIAKTRQLQLLVDEINSRAAVGGNQDDEGKDEIGGSGDDEDGHADNNTEFDVFANEDGGGKRNADSDEDESRKVKRMCNGLGGGFSGSEPRCGEDELARLNANVDNDRVDNGGGTTSDYGSNTMRGNIPGSYENYLELLEERAVQLIEWNLDNRSNDLLESVTNRRFVNNELFQELQHVISRFYDT